MSQPKKLIWDQVYRFQAGETHRFFTRNAEGFPCLARIEDFEIQVTSLNEEAAEALEISYEYPTTSLHMKSLPIIGAYVTAKYPVQVYVAQWEQPLPEAESPDWLTGGTLPV